MNHLTTFQILWLGSSCIFFTIFLSILFILSFNPNKMVKGMKIVGKKCRRMIPRKLKGGSSAEFYFLQGHPCLLFGNWMRRKASPEGNDDGKVEPKKRNDGKVPVNRSHGTFFTFQFFPILRFTFSAFHGFLWKA